MLQGKTVAPATLDLLRKICSIEELRDLNLAGGTALALQIGHRLSVDLDFFGNHELTHQEIIDLLNDLKPLSIISQKKNILMLDIRGVKVDFVNYKYPLLEKLVAENDIRMLSISDIAAMKLAAIAGRGRKRDFYDVFFLLTKFELRQLISFYNKKFEDGSELMVARSLTYFDDAEEDENPILINADINWNEVKQRITKEVKELYGF
jgi:predicted nucleotidyltransferase component of viral defense system